MKLLKVLKFCKCIILKNSKTEVACTLLTEFRYSQDPWLGFMAQLKLYAKYDMMHVYT